MRHGRTLRIAALAMSWVIALAAYAAPSAELWERWVPHDPSSDTVVDHSTWDRLVRDYLRPGPDGVARFAYGSVSPAGRAALSGYLEALSTVGVTALRRAEQKAFWINLYNALTVNVVLEHYPVESIRDISISPGFFSTGPWKKPLISVEGTPLTLDDIEHRILRPGWQDPRVHYVLNCASLGCPNLPPRALGAADLETMLEAAAVAFVNHPRGVRVEDGTTTASKIYEWFRDDFGADERAVLAHVRRYARGTLAGVLAGVETIDRYAYDWDLNDAR